MKSKKIIRAGDGPTVNGVNAYNDEAEVFNKDVLKYCEYGDDGFPAVQYGDFIKAAYFNPYAKEWREVDYDRWEFTGREIGLDEFLKNLKEGGGQFPFDPKMALKFAAKAHEGQFRKDGVTPYIEHPKAVVKMLNGWGITRPRLICAAYLHDVLEDTDVTEDEIAKRFTFFVSATVKTLTREAEEDKADYLKRIAGSGVNALLIKCADRICNTLDFIRDGKADYARTYFHMADCVFNALYNDAFVPEKIKGKVRKAAETLSRRLD